MFRDLSGYTGPQFIGEHTFLVIIRNFIVFFYSIYIYWDTEPKMYFKVSKFITKIIKI